MTYETKKIRTLRKFRIILTQGTISDIARSMIYDLWNKNNELNN